jgi:isoleucyl-tRNA synthetase
MSNNSVHLQNFPDTSFLPDEQDLMADMDMVRQICSTALFIRDKENLRVRLPLQKLTIIGAKAEKMLGYKEIIADEVNIKEIAITPEIGDLAELKLQINFKKVGAKFGSKMKEITMAAKSGNWQKLTDSKIKIAEKTLENDEFEIKLITKNPKNTAALPSNDCLIQLDIEISKELEAEGLARDIVRSLQQNRKDSGLDVSDHITVQICSAEEKIINAATEHQNYIKEQVLADKLEILPKSAEKTGFDHDFDNKIEGMGLKIGLSKII